MHISVILFLITLLIYIPMAAVLLYVWHKYGQGDKGVRFARTVYISGSLLILLYMIFF